MERNEWLLGVGMLIAFGIAGTLDYEDALLQDASRKVMRPQRQAPAALARARCGEGQPWVAVSRDGAAWKVECVSQKGGR